MRNLRFKVYTAKFEGEFPVGTAAVIVAPSKGLAATALFAELQERGLTKNNNVLNLETQMVELCSASNKTTEILVRILCEGNY